jgi:thiol-disulfide isomerase/thioredoxin
MKRRVFELIGFVYVSFAIITAYSAVASTEKAPAKSHSEAEVVSPAKLLRDREPLDNPDTPKIDRSKYKVIVWTTDYCIPCRTYKLTQVPILEKLGYEVVIKDIEESDDIEVAPTVTLYFGKLKLDQKTNWPAIKIEEYVRNRSKLKGQQ